MRPFEPFDNFERGCAPDSKSLHETMQESCTTNLKPEEPPCRKPCIPYWQQTNKKECLEIGLIAVEEANGCGQTRLTRTIEKVIWQNTEEERCDELNNRKQLKQINQCGGERWVNTSRPCCEPLWVNAPNSEPMCDAGVERRIQIDGCGNTRIRTTGNAINWVSTSQTRCEPGDVYQVEQRNQCGEVRWVTVPGGCPCIPNWQPSGPERCGGQFVERQEVDGCGHTRWVPTASSIVWSNNGETRCQGGFIQEQQVNQCGGIRWSTTTRTCSNSPPAVALQPVWVNGLLSGQARDGATNVYVRLEVESGEIVWGYRDNAAQRQAWVTGDFNRNDYEARITLDQGIGDQVTTSGSPLDTWLDLGDVSVVSRTITITGPNNTDRLRQNVLIRIDIRKKGEGTSGGKTFGPFSMRTT